MHDLAQVTVLGAGTMGPTIAAAFAAGGIAVKLWARRPEAASEASSDALLALEFLRAERVLEGPAASISSTADLPAAVTGAGLVLEAISEDLEAKQELFAAVEAVVSPSIPVASTTSGLGVEQLAAESDRPERFLVLHFWNPAHLIPLVEVLGGDRTEPALLDEAEDLLRRLGKHPVRLRRFAAGFIGTRLQQAVVREAIALYEAGVADASDIDAATRLSFGARFPVMGPLETCDLGGLDVVAAIHAYLLKDLDTSAAPQRPLRQLVERGALGAKTGEGFYDWSQRDADELRRRRDVELVGRLRHLRDTGQLPGPGSSTSELPR
jgi:3-hydroxybutyryl-CoA dehydrogenase